MPELKKNPTLADLQKYVLEMGEERGFGEETTLERCLLLGEEVGELYKAIRKKEKIKVDHNSKFGSIDEELGDVLIMLCFVANSLGIDLEEAFRNKEEINKKREWKKDSEQ